MIRTALVKALNEFGYNVSNFDEIKSDGFLRKFAAKLLKNNLKYDMTSMVIPAKYASLDECIDDFISRELSSD